MQEERPTIPTIVYTIHAAIDKQRWDECILKSYNGLVYSTTTYLDTMAGDWDALVMNDYEAVLPLPWRRKFGINYIYPPAFTQQLGVTSLYKEDEHRVAAFLQAIPTKFRHVEINLNATNPLKADSLVARNNFLLPLSDEYNMLRRAYSRSAIRNITKAVNNKIQVIENARAAEIFKLHRNRFKDGIGTKARDYENLLALVNKFIESNHCYCIAAMNSQGHLVAGSIYLIFKNRLYFVLNGNTPESLENGATHLLLDHTIRNFSGRGFVLDFEGSDHPSFARFYQQYGATRETYHFIKYNRLPWPLKILKSSEYNPVL